MPKQFKEGNPEFSRDREFTVVLEDLRGQFRVFGEGLQDVQSRLGRVEDKIEELDQVKQDVTLIKLALPTFATKKDLEEIKAVIPTLATKKDLDEVKAVIPTLATKKDLERFATKEDLQGMEQRLSALEHTR